MKHELNEEQISETKAATELHTKLAAVEIKTVQVASKDRSIARKEQAKLARELFKKLGLKGHFSHCAELLNGTERGREAAPPPRFRF